MIVSFFVGILIIEPLKVALISCCISATCKNVDLDSDDDVEDDEKDPDLADQDQWMGDELKEMVRNLVWITHPTRFLGALSKRE